MTEPSLILTPADIELLTGYTQPSSQLAALKQAGFWRARRNALGQVVLEREHYAAVCAGRAGTDPLPDDTPDLMPITKIRHRSAA